MLSIHIHWTDPQLGVCSLTMKVNVFQTIQKEQPHGSGIKFLKQNALFYVWHMQDFFFVLATTQMCGCFKAFLCNIYFVMAILLTIWLLKFKVGILMLIRLMVLRTHFHLNFFFHRVNILFPWKRSSKSPPVGLLYLTFFQAINN